MSAARLGLVAVAAMVVTACGSEAGAVAMLPSSMSELTESIDAGLATETDWIVAGSSRLVAQLADGADADLLVTADRATMQSALDQGLVVDAPVVVAGNRLVLAVAPGNPGTISTIDDLATDDLLVGVCAIEVPCGRLAADAATTLGLAIAADTEEPNVRSLALKLAGGELDAGLIYATDADALGLERIDDDVLVSFETEYLAASFGPDGDEIVAFLTSPAGRVLLEDAGFTVP